MKTAAVYARISLDRRDGEGVARQVADCREVAVGRGWEVAEYLDNDVSAYRAKRRPAFERLLEDLTDRRIGAVVAYHPDRLYRRLSDLERFVDAVQAAGAEVATVKAGDVDLATASGRMVAAILGSVSRHEAERMGERVARAKRQRAAEGRPAGGGMRPYGLTADRAELVADEAEVIRRVAGVVADGGSITSEVARLNEAGVTTPGGKCWTVGNLTRILTSPHVAAVRTYKGDIVGDATSPAIIDRDSWDLMRQLAKQRKRGRPREPRYLLSGILTCSLCGIPLRNTRPRPDRRNYVCPPWWTAGGKGCSRISIVGPALEEHVIETVTAWIGRPAFVEALSEHLTARADDSAARAELDEVEHRLAILTGRFAAGDLGLAEWDAARPILAARRDAAAARLAPRSVASVPGREMVEMWRDPELEPETRRTLIEMLVAHPVVVLPGREGGRRRPVAERVVLRPTWEVAAHDTGS